jgi:hypothetical protein
MSQKSSIFALFLAILIFQNNGLNAQKQIEELGLGKSSPNLIVITTDGLRWQEVFNGMDFALANNRKFNHGDSAYLFNKYGSISVTERQTKLLPFITQTMGTKGLLFGNRFKENKVDVANPHWFSYPGYNEIFTGYPDSAINSNNYPPNPHENILAFLQKQKAYQNKVIAFGAWDAYNRILNEAASGFPVINGFESLSSILPDSQTKMLAQMLKDSYKPFKEAECLDVFTHQQAKYYLETKRPKAMYISYGETDEWAHEGNYSAYLDAAHQVDAWVAELWQWVQSTPGYKDNTYLLITTDHGRGFGEGWTDHGADVKGASSIWFGLMGPEKNSNLTSITDSMQKNLGVKINMGEQSNNQQLYQKQLAATMAKLLGLEFAPAHPVGEAIY